MNSYRYYTCFRRGGKTALYLLANSGEIIVFAAVKSRVKGKFRPVIGEEASMIGLTVREARSMKVLTGGFSLPMLKRLINFAGLGEEEEGK